MTERAPSRLLLAPDARAAERALLAEVDRAQDGDPLARVVIVVPSSELRRHVLACLVEGGRACLGVQVLTLPALAQAVLERFRESGGAEPSPRAVRAGELLLPLLVERLAASEKSLSAPLAELENGYSGAAGSVRDLLDAGFAPTDLEPALEALAEERSRLGETAVERARALVRVAARALDELGRLGVALESGRQLAAAETLARGGEAALPVARALVHGFADATGAAALLLERLLRFVPTTAILVEPPSLDPAVSSAWRFGARLRERFEGIATAERVPAVEAEAPIGLAPAADLDREVATAIARAATAIECGVVAERIALVARDLAPYRSILEREIDRRALPASGRNGCEHPAARRARALRELLSRRGEATIELVLAAVAARWERRCGAAADALRQAALAAGLLRLRELAADAPTAIREAPPLPRLRTLARDLLAALEALARPQRLRRAAAHLRRIVGDDDPDSGRLLEPITELEREPLASLRATAEELDGLLEALWADAGARPLGGEGGGVALLTVTEARALSFDHLLVLGLARDRFPRRIRSDPFLPDALRVALRAAGLTDLPVKAEGHDEERFLFAQLLAAAPSITISWPARDEDGRELARSTLVDELERSTLPTVATAEPRRAARAAIDAAIDEALATERLGPAFAAAVGEAAARFSPPGSPTPVLSPEVGLAFRNRVVAEYGADPGDVARRDRLGPFFGFAGDAAAADERRRAAPWITTLESLAACGWRTFLERLLRLTPPASPADELPTLPATLAGNVVHHVLEAMAPPELRDGDLAATMARDATLVPWPDAARFEELLAAAVATELRAERIDPLLFALPLATAARELLEVVRDVDWSGGSRSLLGVEARGEAAVPAGSGTRSLRFRVDRVERTTEPPRAVLTDYKTGRPLSAAKRAETRAGHLAKAVAEGRALQLAAYALAATDGGSAALPALARLLYLRPGLDAEGREARLERGDAALLGAPWATLFAVWDRGAFLPRLLDGALQKPFDGCAFCDVRVACVQGDSGARLRLARWATADSEDEPPDAAAARALFDLRRKERRRDSGGDS